MSPFQSPPSSPLDPHGPHHHRPPVVHAVAGSSFFKHCCSQIRLLRAPLPPREASLSATVARSGSFVRLTIGSYRPKPLLEGVPSCVAMWGEGGVARGEGGTRRRGRRLGSEGGEGRAARRVSFHGHRVR